MPKKRKLLKIGIAGCGAIGSTLAKAVFFDFKGKACLSGLYDIDLDKSLALAGRLKNKRLAVRSFLKLVEGSDLIIEATKSGSASLLAKTAIQASRDILVMSVGGIIKDYKNLEALAVKKHASIFIPSGAICGIDGLKAAGVSKIKKVILSTRKPPRALSDVPYVLKKGIRLDNLKVDKLIFQGSAIQATRHFPQNINVAATLSIAGIGPENTIVRIIASPSAKRNSHRVEIESASGSICTVTENVIHPDNPKTSYLAALSAIALLKQILRPLKIGS